MTHRPKTLALLISLIGIGLAPAAHAKASIAVPTMTALDVVRWTPGLQWQSGADDVLHDKATSALWEHPPGVAEAAPAVAPDSEGVQSPPPSASTAIDTVDAPTWSSFAIDLEAAEPSATAAESPQADSAAWASRLGALAQAAGIKLKAATSAGAAVVARLSKRVPGSVAVEPPDDTADDTAIERGIDSTHGPHAPNATAHVRGDSMAPPQAADPEAAPDRWLPDYLAQTMPEAWAGTSPQRIAARVAQRFPAAVPTPHEDHSRSSPTRVLRDSAALLGERREIVVATHKDKVLHRLAAVLKQPPGAVSDLAAHSEDLIVTTEAEKVLQTLLQVSKAGRAVQVRDKRAARHQRPPAPAVALAVLGAELAQPSSALEAGATHVEPQGALTAVDIDLSVAALPEIATLPAAPTEAHPFGSGKLAVSDASLDRVRGGFVTHGLNISFGIERALYVNGALVTSTRLNVSELGGISAGAGAPSLDAATLALIHSGPGNVVSSGSISPTSIGTVVQNTLDGQNIRNLTVINATVNSLGVLRGLNLQSSLRGAVIDSLRR